TGTTEAAADVARGEHATFQIVVRSTEPLTKLRCVVRTLSTDGASRRTIGGAVVRFVGYVPVDLPIPNPPSDQLRKPPADFPDPLLEQNEIDVKPNDAQPIWITIKVPLTAAAGSYRGEVKLLALIGRETVSATIPLVLNVYEATIDKSRLLVTNWFQMSRGIEPFPKKETPDYWELLRRYARDMAEHRQNVSRAAPLLLTDYSGPNNRLRFNFDRFDRWVTIFLSAGIDARIEGQQFGFRKGEWDSPFVVSIYMMTDNKPVERRVDATSTEAIAFYSQFLPALRDHLRRRGWLAKYLQHLADEPIDANAASYRQIGDLVRKFAPEMKTLDAAYTTQLTGAVNIWVPHLDKFQQSYAFFQERKKAGDEVWFYTCVAAQGEYANRFIEQPLLKTRLLHWINFRYGATGYLHWGYNYWTKDPFTDTVDERPGLLLPAGESWIVYPGKDGVIDSIRFEAMRDGIADYEVFAQLAQRNPQAADRLVARHVLDFNKYNCDVDAFRKTRREMLGLLSESPSNRTPPPRAD
ncbi:MAG: glycoside hydrolase domain-containing protein, partial [Tepidisphaeraceae bacterium]